MDRRPVKRRNPFSPETAEGQWVRFMDEQGRSREQIIEAVEERIGGYGSATELVIGHMLGEKSLADIEHLLTPHEPDSIQYVGQVSGGYLLQASLKGSATFNVLMRAPSLSEDEVKALVAAHQGDLCYLVFKNAHEGNQFGYSDEKGSAVALAGISYPEIRGLLK